MEDCEAHEYQGRGGLDLDKIVEEKLCQQCTNTGNHVIKSRGEGFSWINKEMQVAPGQNFSHSSCHNNSRPGRCILMEARCWLVKEDNCLSFFYSLWCQHHWMVDPCPQTLDPEYIYIFSFSKQACHVSLTRKIKHYMRRSKKSFRSKVFNGRE